MIFGVLVEISNFNKHFGYDQVMSTRLGVPSRFTISVSKLNLYVSKRNQSNSKLNSSKVKSVTKTSLNMCLCVESSEFVV